MKFHQKPCTFVSQVELKVENLERSLSFYEEVIGFQILESSERKAILTADGKTPLLSIEQPDNVKVKEPRTTGLYHFALLLPTRADLARALQHFIKMNIRLGASDHLVSEALYLDDPDGNGIEIYADRPSSAWSWREGQVVMATEPLNAENLLKEANGEQWMGLPKAALMGHIHLHVSELEKTEEFYLKGLGFELVTRYGSQALFLSTGGYHHHIGLNTWNGVGAKSPAENSVGLKWFSLVFPTEEDRKNIVMQLKNIGAPVRDENGEFTTEDPSGNPIRLLV
ncbi:catechol 2,3-dioxygenase [Bacillus pakistanensis]|uniref:Catechol 2,3-dioxygenase n=1 Tax=Rossellomorea pakistanensis TaxID=992288 RepID=A0ABS2NED9_9BACI|nr:VOC family protein [Bacillus pakistanensis]MBM7586178.1 catechol 2,3-dioxygenase [Bacillus pakistanensis]